MMVASAPITTAIATSCTAVNGSSRKIHAAVDEGVPTPVLAASLYQRFSSRGRSDIADKVLSAMRAGFGGHHERTESSR